MNTQIIVEEPIYNIDPSITEHPLYDVIPHLSSVCLKDLWMVSDFIQRTYNISPSVSMLPFGFIKVCKQELNSTEVSRLLIYVTLIKLQPNLFDYCIQHESNKGIINYLNQMNEEDLFILKM